MGEQLNVSQALWRMLFKDTVLETSTLEVVGVGETCEFGIAFVEAESEERTRRGRMVENEAISPLRTQNEIF